MSKHIFPTFWKLFILCLIFNTGYSQDLKFRAGIEAGPNVASLSFPQFFRFNDFIQPTLGFSVGGTAQIIFSSNFSIRTGLLFERAGFRINDNFSSLEPQYGYRENLILPVFARISVGKSSQFFFQTGSYASYLTKALFVDQNMEEARRIVTELNPRWDAGLVIGLGVDFPISNKNILSFEWRSSLGIRTRPLTSSFIFSTFRAFSSALLLGFAWQ